MGMLIITLGICLSGKFTKTLLLQLIALMASMKPPFKEGRLDQKISQNLRGKIVFVHRPPHSYDTFVLIILCQWYISSSELPIYFRNPENRKQRHDQWQKIIKDDEIWWKKLQNPDGTADEEADGLTSDWDSSKSAVLGLASGYGLNIYQRAFILHMGVC